MDEHKKMTVQIGLISDPHATVAPLREAFALFEREGVELVLCAGDVAGYGTELDECVELLAQNRCITLMGNHEAWFLERRVGENESPVVTYFTSLPLTWEGIIEGKHLYAVHASPPQSLNRGITLLDQHEKIIPGARKMWTHELAEYDHEILVVGHTHQVFAEMLGSTLVINPGSTKFNHSCMILSLPDLAVRTIPLSGKKVRRFWYWGL